MLERIVNTAGFNSLVKAKYGYLIYNKHDRYIGRSIEKYGEFSEFEVDLFRQVIQPEQIVVEVGANIGAHSLALSALVGAAGRVFAFEPQRIIFQMLCGNLAINSILNVDARQLAVAAEPGIVKLPELRYDLEGNFGGLSITEQNQGYPVAAVTLDDILDVPRLDFLKVDVEGMEQDVLVGGRELIARHRPILYVENDRFDKSRSLIEYIVGLEYRMYWHLPPLFNPKNFSGDPENLFGGLVSANMLCLHRDSDANITGFEEILDPGFHPHRPPGA